MRHLIYRNKIKPRKQMKNEIFHKFPPNTLNEWLTKIEKDLKGKSFDDLYWQADENILLRPFYHPDESNNHAPIWDKKIANDWKIGTNIPFFSIKKTNQRLLQSLSQGVNAPNLVISKNFSAKSLISVFQNVDLHNINIHFTKRRMEPEPLKFLKNFHQSLLDDNYNPHNIKGSISFDLKHPSYKKLLDWKANNLPNFRLFTLECKEVKVSMAKQLTGTILGGIDLIEKNATTKAEILKINNNIQFSVSIGTKFIQEIAKIRALKLLWANVMQSFGIKEYELPPIFINFDSMSFDDNENTNMIRATTMAMSAAIASVDRINVLPADANFAKPTDFTRRIAINVQNILKMESHFAKVTDPTAGSYIIEKLTDEFCNNVWKNI